jgi:membrane bound O-acyltransferase family protein
VLRLFLEVGLVYAAGMIAALLAAGPAWRRAMAVLVMGAASPVPFLAPEDFPAFRAFVALGCLWFMARLIEVLRVPRPLPPARRVWHVVGLVDTFRARRMAPKVDWQAVTRLVLSVPLVAGGFAGVYFGSHLLGGPLRLAVRWSAGAVFLYMAVEVVVALVILVYGLLGIDPRPIHDDPIRAKTIIEFWSRRWNRVVHGFLKQNIFAPVARRGHTELGLVLTFVVSGLIHFAFMLPAVGLSWALMMGAFFLLQVPFLWAERALGVVRWSTVPARLWTLTLLLGSSPLFVEPMLRIADAWG